MASVLPLPLLNKPVEVAQRKSSVLGRSVLDLIGNTPLLSFKRITQDLPPGVKVLAKAEWYNPGGSVKDRAALAMIRDGEARGLLTSDKIIIDATSGNTGIAYAMIGAERGYKVILALPKNASIERKQSLIAYGAEIIYTDPQEGTDGAQRFVKNLVDNDPKRYFYPDQYNNEANWRAHYETTAPEIWRQTGEAVTHFVTGLGTSGTFMGTSRRLRELNPLIKCISMQPDAPLHGLEGMKHMATALVPGIYDPNLADENIEISTEDAHKMVLRLAREEGLLVGVSSGANMVAALRIASRLKEGVVVTIFCDSAAKYLSESFWSEAQSEAENWP
jgi:S-sulfo-L-cysteine synthase (O-acetyl-L-serine-dependent)